MPVKTVFGRGLAAVVETKKSMQTLLPFIGINDLVKKVLHRGRSSKVSLRRPRATWAVRVFRAVLREVAVAALETMHIGSLDRLLRVESNPPDAAEAHVEKLASLFASWSGLMADEFVPLVRLELTLDGF